ncbi:NADP-dependent oxidoreductase domain-containing protein [Pavlovales sp. CCMP2436]|nr:NADP-dependent oxidoreductase domain-containing protein [Pavlovales sp. CCMP2436]
MPLHCLLVALTFGAHHARPGAHARARASMSSPATTAAKATAEALADRVNAGTLSLSALGVGALNWPLDKKEDAQTAEAVSACVAGGVDFIDTAEAYGFGRSEELVRSCVASLGSLERPVTVATKFAPVPWRFGADSLVDACRASKERLGVQAIDLYQIHFPDGLCKS